jgi:death on curing protein
MSNYLSLAEIRAINLAVMERTGSAPEALRDEGLLESAAMRPHTAAYYEGADLVRQAVLLAIGISQNQPFVDGNKRTAYGALDTFLRINGWAYADDPVAIAKQLEKVAERSTSLENATDAFEQWLRERVKPIVKP